MKKQTISMILLILIVGILLASCSGEHGGDTPDILAETNENLFTQPSAPETEDNSEQEIEINPDTGKPFAYVGGLSFALYTTPGLNTRETFVYEGGELQLGLQIQASGNLNQADFGMLLFLDGLPQPYRTESDDTLAYLHVFHSDTGLLWEEVYLTPVTGKAGDTLELSYIHLLDPEYYHRTSSTGFQQTGSGTVHTNPVEFRADPPEAQWPEVPERVVTQSVTTVDLTSADTVGWTAEDLQNNSSFTVTTDHESKWGWTYAVTPEGGITVRAEVFGCTAVDWGFLIYVNHQPVTIQPENRIFFHTQNGKKTVIEVKLDLSDFDGEEILYAIRFARNWKDPAVFNGKNNESLATKTHFLTDAVDVDAAYEKYGVK